ncbi:MAG: DUF2802 domain-containing protein [Pontibacterium sp.]
MTEYVWIGLSLLSVSSLLGLLVVWLRLRVHEKKHNALVNVLRNEIQSMTNSSIGMGKRVLEVERRVTATAEKQAEIDSRDPTAVAYTQAARLMEMGAGVDDLIESCGIGRPEAELMALLHKELKAPGSRENDQVTYQRN